MLKHFHLALVFMTRLPLPTLIEVVPGGLARAMRLFPLVGLVIGLIGAATYGAAHALLPAGLAALLALAATVWATGCLHEDGLADLADGFGGGRTKLSKLEIMRDSRIGSYGVVAVVFGLLLRAGAIAALESPAHVAVGLIAAHALARATIPLAMQILEPARTDGLGAGAGQPDRSDAGIAATLALLIAAIALPIPAALAAVAGALLGAAIIAVLAQRHVGGQTGDVLGGVEQAAETLSLLGVVAAL